jgi:hypothetical protein
MVKMQPEPKQQPAAASVEPTRQSAEIVRMEGYLRLNVKANTQWNSYNARGIAQAVDTQETGDAMANLTREELDAKLATMAAQTDTKIARLEGKLDVVIIEIRSVNDTFRNVRDGQRAVIANIWVVFAALAAIIIGAIAAAPGIFDLGIKLRETITKEVQERTSSPPAPQQQVK